MNPASNAGWRSKALGSSARGLSCAGCCEDRFLLEKSPCADGQQKMPRDLPSQTVVSALGALVEKASKRREAGSCGSEGEIETEDCGLLIHSLVTSSATSEA